MVSRPDPVRVWLSLLLQLMLKRQVNMGYFQSGTPLITYGKVDGLDDPLITTKEKLIQFSWLKPTRRTFLLVRPWDRHLLELSDFADSDDAESLRGWSEFESLDGSPGEEELTDFKILLCRHCD
ncbi:uncharacterized protein F5891DRAFT_275174 [Suillus fuscotomentosus]|uniref:Uncharacterized protein n=1 Tax=Suillus fuscotomentosus TaxID=1912939 RepID=A0AAD4E7B1_9AGAM|nr:uncharacterized protein F5891DRAFT_275174 [Suillus fuscotomentosus]KAG1900966.1 hypothetical protein F5891DRAFT_275174 [Suillus fuscotomentosus]